MSTAVHRPDIYGGGRAAALALPPLPPLPEVAAPRFGAAVPSWRRLRQNVRDNWACLGPHCAEHNGLRAWWKWPGRVQLQQGWCCSPDCFQTAFEVLAARILRHHEAAAPRPHRIPLGLTLLSQGMITRQQLRSALELQQARGGRLGAWLVRAGAATEEAIAAGVALQWARPTFPLAQSQGWRQCLGWVPLAMVETLRMLPLHYAAARRRLYVGFTQTVDAQAVNALAEIFGCSAESCIVTDAAFDAALEQLRAAPEASLIQDVNFDHLRDPSEVAGVVRQYARYAEARQVRVAEAGPFLWVRIRGERAVHLTFRYR